MGDEQKIKILITKAGLDSHERGVSLIIRCLRDAGMEIIYSGLYQTPESIVASAIQEDVDYIFLSSHVGIHLAICRDIMELLNKRGAKGVGLVVGGIIPKRDIPALKELGVLEAFGAWTLPSAVVNFARSLKPVPTKR